MRVGYRICLRLPAWQGVLTSGIKKNLPLLAKRVVMVAGLLMLPLTSKLEKVSGETVPVRPRVTPPLAPAPRPDPRIARLRRFLKSLHCPVSAMAEDFVRAADDNHLDWRLLPSIAVIESGGGKAYLNNNIFGWNQGLQAFPSIRAGLHLVAFKLGRSPLYRNLDAAEKLHYYNPDGSYPGKVIAVMNRISPTA